MKIVFLMGLKMKVIIKKESNPMNESKTIFLKKLVRAHL